MRTIFSITIFLSLILALFCYKKMAGGWTKQSLDRNDTNIDAAFNAVRSSVLQSANSNESIDLIPVAVFTQVVNGINYKIIAAIKDTTKKSVSLVSSVVYLGLSSQSPRLKSVETLPTINSLGLLEQSELSELNNEVALYLKQKQLNLTSLVSINAYPNLVNENDGYYVINVNISSGNIESNQFLIVNEEIDPKGNKTYSNLQVNLDS
jgi:hypothetical protein